MIPGLRNTTGFGPVRLWGGTSTDPAQYLPAVFPIYLRDYISGSVLLGYKEGNTSTDSLTCDSMCLFIPKLSGTSSADLSFAYYSKESVEYMDMGPDPMDPFRISSNKSSKIRSSSNKSSKNEGPNWLLRCYGGTPLNMVIRPFANSMNMVPGYNFYGDSGDTIRYCAY